MLLAERGVEVVVVEPDEAMALVARRNLTAYPESRVEVSDFEDWEPDEDGTFDLVACAQAWHWIDRERGTRRAERLLRSGGWLAIFGSKPDPQDTPLRRDIDAAYAAYAPEPSAQAEASRRPVPAKSAFAQVLTRKYESWQDYTADEWVALLRTSSDHIVLPQERRDPLLEAVAAAIERHGGTYRHHVVHELWAGQRS